MAATAAFLFSAAAGWHLGPGRHRRAAATSSAPDTHAHHEPPDADAPTAHGERDRAAGGRLETNPRAPGYDAIRVGQVMDLPVTALFDREPRDATWASTMEADQRATIEQVLHEAFADASIDELECRTATCRVGVSVAAADLEAMVDLLQVYVPIGEVLSYTVLDDGPERAHVQWNMAFGPQRRTLAALTEHVRRTNPTLERRRRQWIDGHRSERGH